MKTMEETLEDVRSLHKKLLGRSAPEITEQSFVPFPFGVDPIQHARQEVQQLKDTFERMTATTPTTSWTPPLDCLTTANEFVVWVEVPGVSREDLKVLVVGGECIVRGERKQHQLLGEARPVTIERPWGRFERRFAVPSGSRVAETVARVADGMLELRIPLEGSDAPIEQEIVVS